MLGLLLCSWLSNEQSQRWFAFMAGLWRPKGAFTDMFPIGTCNDFIFFICAVNWRSYAVTVHTWVIRTRVRTGGRAGTVLVGVLLGKYPDHGSLTICSGRQLLEEGD